MGSTVTELTTELSANGVSALTTVYQVVGTISSASVAITVPIAILSLRRVILQRRSESLEKVINELRDSKFRDLAASVYSNFPLPESASAEDRVRDFVIGRQDLSQDTMKNAIELVNRLNNIAAMIDQSAVRETDLHGQTHPRIIELAARLDPFILARSAVLGYRWGMRVRRLGEGAKRYYRTSSLHNRKALVRSGITLVESTSGWRWRISRDALRALVGRYVPSAQEVRSQDERDLEAARRVLDSLPASQVHFLDPHRQPAPAPHTSGRRTVSASGVTISLCRRVLGFRRRR
ncbi:hypothetical protein LG314_12550 [Agrococcus terreus]|uniref:hypothetical protein n=1 Tax=Agrococcus terreus TaxID=574649 RepID=UPI00384AC61A